jgi:hypothetical protein
MAQMGGLTPEELQQLLNGPALTPPPGVTSNFDHPETLAVYVVPTIALALSFSTLAIAARIIARRLSRNFIGWEDCECLHQAVMLLQLTSLDTAILGWVGRLKRLTNITYLWFQVMLVAFCVPCTYCGRYGGAHQWDTRLKDFMSLLYVRSTLRV